MILFINNENEWKKLEVVRKELMGEKKVLEVAREEEKTDLVAQFYNEDSDCLAAGKPLKDMDFHLSTIIPLETLGIRFVGSTVCRDRVLFNNS